MPHLHIWIYYEDGIKQAFEGYKRKPKYRSGKLVSCVRLRQTGFGILKEIPIVVVTIWSITKFKVIFVSRPRVTSKGKFTKITLTKRKLPSWNLSFDSSIHL